MDEYVLAKGEVSKVMRKDFFGDPHYWLVQPMIPNSHRVWYVCASNCIPLDPALNILFERKDHE